MLAELLYSGFRFLASPNINDGSYGLILESPCADDLSVARFGVVRPSLLHSTIDIPAIGEILLHEHLSFVVQGEEEAMLPELFNGHIYLAKIRSVPAERVVTLKFRQARGTSKSYSTS